MNSSKTRTGCVEPVQTYDRWVDERKAENTSISRLSHMRNSIYSNLETL
jgi:hypothetical protein